MTHRFIRKSCAPYAASIALAAGLLSTGPAGAAVMILGEGLARECSRAAFAGRSDGDAQTLCSRSLQEESLSRKDRAGTHVNRAIMSIRSRAYSSATTDIDAAIRLAPGLGEAHVNRGVLLMADQRYEEALQHINRGIELGVDEPAKAHYNRALVHESLTDAKSAYLDYQLAASLAPEWLAPARQMQRFRVVTR